MENNPELIYMYAIYDKQSQTYDTPFFAANDIFAERQFIMMMEKEGSIWARFKADLELLRIGSFNVLKGNVVEYFKKIKDGRLIISKEKNEEVEK